MKLLHNILSLFGRPRAVQASGQPYVHFIYDHVGNNTNVRSSVADDWERTYTYDRLGRRLTYVEGGLSESITYDGGNLSTHTQSWSENGLPQSRTTHYHYNAHRLDSVSYDDALTTIYHYDQYGRMDSLYDESGVMYYEYGNMGEVTQETRIYALPFLSQPIALTTQFEYDSLLPTGGSFTAANMRLRRASPCCRWIWPDTPPESITTAWNTKGRGR